VCVVLYARRMRSCACYIWQEVIVNTAAEEIPQGLAPTVQALENEYRRLAQQISSGPGQLLANAIFELRSAKQLLRTDLEAAEQGLDALLDELQQGLGELQQMVFGLQPSLLEEVGLEPVLRRYAQTFQESTGITVDWHFDPLSERLPPTLEIVLFRIVQESLRNTQKHAQAGHVSLRLVNGTDSVTLIVEDDGKGFREGRDAAQVPRTGWLSMRNRAELVGGELHVFDRAAGGMRITLEIPYAVEDDQAA